MLSQFTCHLSDWYSSCQLATLDKQLGYRDNHLLKYAQPKPVVVKVMNQNLITSARCICGSSRWKMNIISSHILIESLHSKRCISEFPLRVGLSHTMWKCQYLFDASV